VFYGWCLAALPLKNSGRYDAKLLACVTLGKLARSTFSVGAEERVSAVGDM
jgi:hypothetical protein